MANEIVTNVVRDTLASFSNAINIQSTIYLAKIRDTEKLIADKKEQGIPTDQDESDLNEYKTVIGALYLITEKLFTTLDADKITEAAVQKKAFLDNALESMGH